MAGLIFYPAYTHFNNGGEYYEGGRGCVIMELLIGLGIGCVSMGVALCLDFKGWLSAPAAFVFFVVGMMVGAALAQL